jgi:hypothetical protein
METSPSRERRAGTGGESAGCTGRIEYEYEYEYEYECEYEGSSVMKGSPNRRGAVTGPV